MCVFWSFLNGRTKIKKIPFNFLFLYRLCFHGKMFFYVFNFICLSKIFFCIAQNQSVKNASSSTNNDASSQPTATSSSPNYGEKFLFFENSLMTTGMYANKTAYDVFRLGMAAYYSYDFKNAKICFEDVITNNPTYWAPYWANLQASIRSVTGGIDINAAQDSLRRWKLALPTFNQSSSLASNAYLTAAQALLPGNNIVDVAAFIHSLNILLRQLPNDVDARLTYVNAAFAVYLPLFAGSNERVNVSNAVADNIKSVLDLNPNHPGALNYYILWGGGGMANTLKAGQMYMQSAPDSINGKFE